MFQWNKQLKIIPLTIPATHTGWSALPSTPAMTHSWLTPKCLSSLVCWAKCCRVQVNATKQGWCEGGCRFSFHSCHWSGWMSPELPSSTFILQSNQIQDPEVNTTVWFYGKTMSLWPVSQWKWSIPGSTKTHLSAINGVMNWVHRLVGLLTRDGMHAHQIPSQTKVAFSQLVHHRFEHTLIRICVSLTVSKVIFIVFISTV